MSESLCIFVRLVEGQGQFITSKGYWYVSSNYQLKSGRIENFASPDDLAPILPYLPDAALRKKQFEAISSHVSAVGDMPIDVTAPIVKRLIKVEQDINAFQRRHASTLDGLHEMLADDEELAEWKVEDLVPKAFGIPYNEVSVAGRLALDRFAVQTNHGIFRSNLSGSTYGYFVRSRKDMQMQNQVMDWARMYQESAAKAALGKDVKEDLRNNPLSAFINKAHRLILRSRKIRSPTTLGLLGPSAESGDGSAISAVDTGETLTGNDRLIIRFVFEASQIMPPLVPSEAQSICALIYRAIGAYPNLSLGRKVARLLLQELGVISPWKDRELNLYQLRLAGLGIWPYHDRLMAKAEASCKDLSVFRLPAQPARKDWGQMPVYCIDGADTVEIDDGISVEPATNMPDCAWIHIHVANPAAYISRDHPIAAAASGAIYSTYTPSRKYSMIPPNFAQNLSSLAAGRPVMTVSTLLQADGSVLDIELSLGMIRNVIRLTPSAVEEALEERKMDQATMVIGGARPARNDDGEDSQNVKQALPDLLLLRQFLRGRFRKRLNEWPVEERMQRSPMSMQIDLWTNLREEHVPLLSGKISHWKGDPIIVVEADRYFRCDDGFDYQPVVNHAMVLAGESAAKWCKDREIPILYHVATPHPLFPVSKLNQLEDSEYRLEPGGRISANPQPHWILGIWQYTKISSPIRRYPDLLNQWQIQAYLQAVSRESQDPKDARPLDRLSELPFTQQDLEDMVRPMNSKITLLRRAGMQSTQHFLHQAFFRAFHFKEAEIPEVWDFKVIGPGQRTMKSSDSTGILGVLVPFRARAELLASAENWEKNVGRSQYLPVKIEVVDAEQDRIFVKAVGPPSDSAITTHPVHIQSSKKPVSPGKDGPEQQQR